MNKIELSTLLLMPVLIPAISIASIVSYSHLSTFESELKERSNEISLLKEKAVTFIQNSQAMDSSSEKTHELTTLIQNSLGATEGALIRFGDFSDNIKTSINKLNCTIIFWSILNIILILSVYRKLRRVLQRT